ncbi:peptide ABC transporter permease [Sinirhodobacter populi]|uniref:Peptide ABC transporter permease n=1 Tax=Paenirhodobacter populi TaxID=2306993 RepID=A0A443KHQ6_9RHOB|nr:DMT family transporter [Sinirhodobacter populi]RWR32279.1 peptide ABC transporter permease [Sinirhodobacter populi]
MSLTVFLAVLAAAFLHASWNALLRLGGSKIQAMAMLSCTEIVIGLAIVASRPLPAPGAWKWLAATTVAQVAYKFFLARAYEEGDLSRVYPLARGTAPMLVALVTAVFALDHIAATGYLGIAVLGCGILFMARGVFTDGESRKMLPFAAGSAIATASYTLIDGIGGRVSGDVVAYVGWLLLFSGAGFAGGMVALRGPGLIRGQSARAWLTAGLAATISYIAYAVSIWAMTRAPIALVAVLRETSILFAVLIGWLAFGERMTRAKALAAGLIVVGVVMTRI